MLNFGTTNGRAVASFCRKSGDEIGKTGLSMEGGAKLKSRPFVANV